MFILFTNKENQQAIIFDFKISVQSEGKTIGCPCVNVYIFHYFQESLAFVMSRLQAIVRGGGMSKAQIIQIKIDF